MRLGMGLLRGGLVAVLVTLAAPLAAGLAVIAADVSPAYAQSVASIEVEGNRRVEADTIRSYFKPGPDGRLDQGRINDGLRALYDTGLFQDVKIGQRGGRMLVTVVENPVIGRVLFEGNRKVKDEQLSTEVQSKPRGSLSRPMVQSDVQRITDIYHHMGRYDVKVVPQLIDQPNNRVDLIFEITENAKTGVKEIEFIGNNAYSSYRLKDVIKTRESNILSFLSSADIYDADRVEADRDLIRRFYLKNGYADVQVVAVLSEYDPERKGFTVTFKIEEGQQYRVGSIDVRSNIRSLDASGLRSYLRMGVGSVYNAEALEKSVEDITVEASRRGYAFATVRPQGDRNFENHTVAIALLIDEGQRTYVERINIRGNTRTRDYVIRREFDLSEGDAYNRALVDRAERRLKNLDYFKSVKITNEPGSSPDRIILNVDIEEKSTGDFSVSGGYSTSDGFIADVSISERNLLGTGLYAKAGVSWGQRSRGYTFSLVEPYLFGYRVAGGLDVFMKSQLASSYVSYNTKTFGVAPRLVFALREDLTMQLRYAITKTEVSINPLLSNCNNINPNFINTFPTPLGTPNGLNSSPGTTAPNPLPVNQTDCYADGEASLAIKKEMLAGPVWTSLVGYGLTYNLLDNVKDPTTGLLVDFRQDFAGLGGNVKYIRTSGDLRYYFPVVSDIVGVLHGQAGIINGYGGTGGLRMLDQFQMGPNLVRGFAPSGLGPRDLTPGTSNDSLGGTKYWGASAEMQMPFWFLPKEIGLRGSLFADAGSVWDWDPGTLTLGPTVGGVQTRCWNVTNECLIPSSNNMIIRSSVGAGLIWSSPFGPLRFDFAFPVTKASYDRKQWFRFGGGTSF
jgi:outer membrane protein insertion porin family